MYKNKLIEYVELSMKANVSAVCRSVRFHLRRIGLIRKYLTKSATEQLVHALISSRLDYCNSLYIGINTTEGWALF